MRTKDMEDYGRLKVSLESIVQLLEQQMELMRAAYQLNAETLDYNHSVLEECDAENRVRLCLPPRVSFRFPLPS